MKWIVAYVLFTGMFYLAALAGLLVNYIPELTPFKLPLICAVSGGLGGVLYCIRAVYLNACVRKHWDEGWHIWYFLRPIASAGCGAVSYIFLRAGLLVLESDTALDASEFGFYALAFIAGLNVDKFIKKIEDIGETVFGIEKSRSQSQNEGGKS